MTENKEGLGGMKTNRATLADGPENIGCVVLYVKVVYTLLM